MTQLLTLEEMRYRRRGRRLGRADSALWRGGVRVCGRPGGNEIRDEDSGSRIRDR